MNDPTLRQGEKVVTNATPIVKVTIMNPILSIKSQCMNLYPFLTMSYD
jgi:hypothetical protein